MSRTRCVALLAKTLIRPFAAGTMAMFEVTAASSAFSVDTVGRAWPYGHIVRYPNGPGGTTVAPITCACAAAGTAQGLAPAFTSRDVIGIAPPGSRVSATLHGVTP